MPEHDAEIRIDNDPASCLREPDLQKEVAALAASLERAHPGSIPEAVENHREKSRRRAAVKAERLVAAEELLRQPIEQERRRRLGPAEILVGEAVPDVAGDERQGDLRRLVGVGGRI